MHKIIAKLFIILLISNGLKAQTFQQTTISSGLPELGNSNMAWGDYDQDGDYDVILSGMDEFTNVSCTLYQNNGDTTFKNSGVALPQVYQGDLLFADFNNDNFIDVAISGRTEENLKITELYSNNGDGSFTKIITDIDSVYNSSLVSADFNNDGKIDILISGTNNLNTRICTILKNNGDNTFQKINTSIEGIANGTIQPADFNKDGKIDLLLFGINNINQFIGKIYLNEGNFNFSPQTNSFPEFAYSSSATADFNQDGFIDFAVSGINENGTILAKIFKNNGNVTFTDINANITGLYETSLKWADFDNDGDFDLITCGTDASQKQTILYKNQGSDTFTETSETLTEISQGEISFIDFDDNKKIDIVISGYSDLGAETILYRNITDNSNENPTASLNTFSETSDNSVFLKWSKGNDNQTQSNGLTYNISAGTSKFNIDILSPSADISNGKKFMAQQGSLFTDTFALINNLNEGKYYWQVQSIDNGFLGSSFSEPDSFIICSPISLGNDTNVCINSNIQLNIGENDDIVNWYSTNLGLIQANSFNLDFTVTETDTIWVELTNTLGCNKIDSIIIIPALLPEINFPSDTSVCKGNLLNLQTGTEPDSVNWYSNEGILFADTFNFSMQINTLDTIWAEVISQYGCINKDTIIADTLTLPYFTLGTDTFACYSDNIEFSVSGLDSVNWYSPHELLSANSENIIREILQNDTLICETYNLLSCSYTDTIITYVKSLPIANTGNDTTICYNTNITLGANPAVTSGTPPYSYFWQTTENISDPNIGHPIISPLETAQYILTVNDFYNCTDEDTIYVNVNPATSLNVPDNYTICKNETVQLGGFPTVTGSLFPYIYNWAPRDLLLGFNTSNPIAHPTDTTQYRLIISTYLCEKDTAYVTVNVRPIPNVIAGKDVIVGYGESIILEASGASTYRWQPDLYLDDYQSDAPEVSPLETIIYTVKGTDETGCTNTDTIKVTLINEIFIPNLFTPNNDGNNDVFKIYGTGIKNISLTIFNKEGKIVFKSSDKETIMQTGWDGTYNGQTLPDSAYIWIISGTYNNNTKIDYKGNRGSVFLIK